MVSTSLENLLGKLNCYEIANKLINTGNGIAMSLFINRRQDVVFALRYLLNSWRGIGGCELVIGPKLNDMQHPVVAIECRGNDMYGIIFDIL